MNAGDVLVVAADHAVGEDVAVAGGQRLDDPEQHAPHHRPGQIADAPEHGGGERLEAGQEAHRVFDGAEVGGVHDAGQRGEHRPDDEGERDDRVRIDPHQRRGLRVFGRGPHRPADARLVDKEHQAGEREHGEHEDQNLHRIDHGTADVVELRIEQKGKRFRAGLPQNHGEGLQQQRHAHRGDQRRQARRIAQWPVGELLDEEVENRAHDHGGEQGDQHQHPAGPPELGEGRDHRPGGHGTHHEHFAVGEVDQVDHAVDHRVSECDQRIDASQHQPVDHLLNESFHRPNIPSAN